jgi:hypothetical protein
MPKTQIGAESALCKSNVVRLPTAAKRQVWQPAKAARTARASDPWRGEYIPPHVRGAKKSAYQKSPELLLLISMIAVLTPKQRAEIKKNVFAVAFHFGDAHSHAAYEIISELCVRDE